MPIKDLIDEPSRRIKELESLLEKQQRIMDRMRRTRDFKFKPASRRNGKQGFLRVYFGDMHGARADEKAIAAFLSDMRELKPAHSVCVGDGVDCSGFLAEHHTIGIVPELDYSYEADCNATNTFLDAHHEATSGAPLDYIEGNHEGRIGRWVAKATLRHHRDAQVLEDLYGPAARLSLEKRGIRYIRRHLFYDGLSISGTIKLDPQAVAQHGESVTGKNGADTLLSRLGKNVFFGNTHWLRVVYSENIDNKLVAVNTGCLCILRPVYGLTKTTNWVHGYAIQFVQPGKGFLAIVVPIIDGTSYLQPLLRMMK